MKKNRFGYQMDDEAEENLLSGDEEKVEVETGDYEFEGYDVEINTKVALLPKTTNKP